MTNAQRQPRRTGKLLANAIPGSLSHVYLDCVTVVSFFFHLLPSMPSQAFLSTPYPPRLQDPARPPPLCSLLWLLPGTLGSLKALILYHVLAPNLMPGSLLSPATYDGIWPNLLGKETSWGPGGILLFSPYSVYSVELRALYTFRLF